MQLRGLHESKGSFSGFDLELTFHWGEKVTCKLNFYFESSRLYI